MKNLFLTLSFILLTSILFSQTVIDMAGEPLQDEMENGNYYVKDVNNYMGPYIGTWHYINGNTEFRITLTKVTKYHEIDVEYNDNYYIDGLLIRYQKFENGNQIFQSPIEVYPTGIIKEPGKLNMSFTDYQRNDEIFPLDLILISTGIINHFNLEFSLDRFERRNAYYENHPNEPYFSVPNNIIMIKM